MAAARGLRRRRKPDEQTEVSAKSEITTVTSAKRGSSSSSSKTSASSFIGYFILFLVTLIVYSPTFSADYVWDDFIFSKAQQVRSGRSGLYDIWFRRGTIKQENHYWPMVYTSFWLDYQIWGDSPRASHITNVCIHVVNSCLVHRIARYKLGLNSQVAWLSAMLFALHPVHVESVAWAIERKDTLSGLFYLLSIWAYPFTSNVGAAWNGWKSWRSIVLPLVLYAAGLLTKTMVVSLPAVLLLVPWYLRGRIRQFEFLASIPFFVVGIAIVLDDMKAENKYATDVTQFEYSFVERVGIACRAVCFYLLKLVWPRELIMMYPLWNVKEQKMFWAGYVAFVVTALDALFALRMQIGRGPISALLFFGMTISPALCLIDYSYMSYSFVADRHQYLAMSGPTLLFAASMSQMANYCYVSRPKRSFSLIISVTLAFLCGFKSFSQSSVYRSESSYFNHIISHNDKCPQAWYHLGIHYRDVSLHEDAVRCFREAVVIMKKRQNMTKTHIHDKLASKLYFNQGNSLSNVGKHEEAFDSFHLATVAVPGYTAAWKNMGLEAMRLGKWEDAEKPLRMAMAQELSSPNASPAKVMINLARTLKELGKDDDALKTLNFLLAINPDNERAKQMLREYTQSSIKKR